MSLPTFRALLIAALSSLLPASAVASLPPTTAAITVRAFSHEVPLTNLHVRQGKSFVPLPLQPYRPGAPLALTAGANGHLEFFLKNDTASPPAWQQVASVRPPPDSRELMLAFIPESSSGTGLPRTGAQLTVKTYDCDARTFPLGCLRFINFSPRTVGLRLGETGLTLNPGEERVLPVKGDLKNRVFGQFASQTESGWKLFFQNPLILNPESRTTYLFAYSSSVLAERGQPGDRLPDGRYAPAMVFVQWQDQAALRPSTSPNQQIVR